MKVWTLCYEIRHPNYQPFLFYSLSPFNRRQIELRSSKLLPHTLIQQLPWEKQLVKLQILPLSRYCSHPAQGELLPASPWALQWGLHSSLSWSAPDPHSQFVSCLLLVHMAFQLCGWLTAFHFKWSNCNESRGPCQDLLKPAENQLPLFALNYTN